MGNHRRSAGGVLHHGQRVVLLHKRLNDEYRLPKGGVDGSETDLQAALREVGEETGFADLAVTADLGESEVEYRTPDGWVEQTQHYFLLGLRGFRRLPRSPRDAQRFAVLWFPLDEALERISFASERQVLRSAAAHLRDS